MERRDVLKTIAGGAAVAVAAPAVARSHSRSEGAQPDVAAAGPAPVVDSPAPWALVAPLAAGTPLTEEWILRDVTPVARGGFAVELVHRQGHEARVAVCARGDEPAGIRTTDRLDLIVVNHGRGLIPTTSHLEQAVDALAERLGANEAGADAALARMLSFSARVGRFGPEVLL